MKQFQSLSVPPLSWKTFALTVSSLLLVIVISSTVIEGGQQFPLLAQSFLQGKLYVLSPFGGIGQDPVLYNGKIYWSEGPFPAVLFMPFMGLFELFHHFFFVGYLTWILVIASIYFLLRIARGLGYSQQDSYLLMLGFTLGSAYIGVIAGSSSWFIAQVITTLLLFWVLAEFYTRKPIRWWLIGILIGLIALTRLTATPIIIFFVLYLLYERKDRARLWRDLAAVCFPTVVALGLLGLYNYLRFGNPLDSGSTYQLLSQKSAASRALGVISPIHIPTNFYSAILKGPDPVLRGPTSWSLKFPYITANSTEGMSIFVTSPYLLQLFTYKWSEISRTLRFLLLAICISALAIFSYFGIGAEQFGYRYALDFMPALFVLFMILYRKNHDRLSTGMSWLLLGAGVFNFYLLAVYMF